MQNSLPNSTTDPRPGEDARLRDSTECTISIDPISQLSEEQQREVDELHDIVYPPNSEAMDEVAMIQWAPKKWRVGIWAPNGVLACHVGFLTRRVIANGQEFEVGGIGSVKTHPGYRRRGYAAKAIRAAVDWLAAHERIPWAMLGCFPRLLAYYSSLGWREFNGKIMVIGESGEKEEFTLDNFMTLDVSKEAPAEGVIDIQGAPW